MERCHSPTFRLKGGNVPQDTPEEVMYDELQGKVAIITGAGRERGIGQGIARRFAREGVDVVIGDICRPFEAFPDYGLGSWEYLVDLAEEIEAGGTRALPVKVDVGAVQEVEAMVEKAKAKFGRIDILVNNAGAAPGGGFVLETSDEAWRLTMDACINGAFYCCRAVIPYMLEAGRGGRIINISSIAGKTGAAAYGPYACGKAALILLTQTLGKEFGGKGITANALCPGAVDTLLYDDELEMISQLYDISREEAHQRFMEEVPIGRAATADDIANVAAFLASEQACYINAQSINVCGGWEVH
jgi:NAD(P)-dependent dehydrogenase (short-subunit alcohol dehydrogenase family)